MWLLLAKLMKFFFLRLKCVIYVYVYLFHFHRAISIDCSYMIGIFKHYKLTLVINYNNLAASIVSDTNDLTYKLKI